MLQIGTIRTMGLLRVFCSCFVLGMWLFSRGRRQFYLEQRHIRQPAVHPVELQSGMLQSGIKKWYLVPAAKYQNFPVESQKK